MALLAGQESPGTGQAPRNLPLPAPCSLLQNCRAQTKLPSLARSSLLWCEPKSVGACPRSGVSGMGFQKHGCSGARSSSLARRALASRTCRALVPSSRRELPGACPEAEMAPRGASSDFPSAQESRLQFWGTTALQYLLCFPPVAPAAEERSQDAALAQRKEGPWTVRLLQLSETASGKPQLTSGEGQVLSPSHVTAEVTQQSSGHFFKAFDTFNQWILLLTHFPHAVSVLSIPVNRLLILLAQRGELW